MNDEFITLSSKVDFREERYREKENIKRQRAVNDLLMSDWVRDHGDRGKGPCLVKYNRDLDHSLAGWRAEKDRE